MSEKCFCHFGGYQVKDPVARIEAESARFYFPSLESGGYSGSSAIMTVCGKCVLLDCGPFVNWEAQQQYYSKLHAEGVFSNIDYIVISHYHYDHVENLANILDAYPHENCVAYLPMNQDGYLVESEATDAADLATIKGLRQTVLDTLDNYGIRYIEVSEETKVNIADGFCEMTLFNSTTEDYEHYRDIASLYNNFSMCALIKTGEQYSLFPGDIQRDAQIRIAATRILPKLFLYAIHHHGYQNDDFLEYLDMIQPEHCVLSISYSRMATGYADGMAANYASENIYSNAYGECQFVVGKHAGSVVIGKKLQQCGWINNNHDIYINNEYAGSVHDGSEEHPFTCISEFINFVKPNRVSHYHIRVKATATPYKLLWIRNLSKHIAVTGYSDDGESKPVLQGLYVYACRSAEFTNLIFSGEGKDNRIAYINAASVIFENCEFEAPGNFSDNMYRAVHCNKGSDVYLKDCEIRNSYYGISTNQHAKVVTHNIHFSNIKRGVELKNIDLTIMGEDTLDDDVGQYLLGNTGQGAQVKITTRAEGSNIKALIAKNSGSVISNPFYWAGTGVCMAIGAKLYSLETTEI